LRFWRESSLIIPKNYDAPRQHGIPLHAVKPDPIQLLSDGPLVLLRHE
jgi:hypothetical protein